MSIILFGLLNYTHTQEKQLTFFICYFYFITFYVFFYFLWILRWRWHRSIPKNKSILKRYTFYWNNGDRRWWPSLISFWQMWLLELLNCIVLHRMFLSNCLLSLPWIGWMMGTTIERSATSCIHQNHRALESSLLLRQRLEWEVITIPVMAPGSMTGVILF